MAQEITMDITPDKSLIQKLGLTGYSTADALSELLDNSIDALDPDEPGRIDIVLNYSKKTISVKDDGHGMNLDELKNGFVIARETKPDGKLGKFGLGMKSACSALGKEFTITTSRPDSDDEYTAHYDEEDWLKNAKTWKDFQIRAEKKPQPWHGTVIKISKLNVPIYPNQTATLRRKFETRYGSYIRSNQMSIHVNSLLCRPVEARIQKDSRREIRIDLPDGNYLTGWIGLLDKRSVRGEYGIHLYKNNRLIKAFDKFGIRNHPEVAKIIGEMHLDHVPVNFHKTGFIEESAEYVAAVTGFRTNPSVIDMLRSLTRRAVPDGVQSVLNYCVNDQVMTDVKASMSNTDAKSLLGGIGSISTDLDSDNITMEFIDGQDEELYRAEQKPGGLGITINKKSPVFRMVKNPLFLIGLIGLEAKTAASRPKGHADFVRERNAAWNKMVLDWSEARKTIAHESHNVVPLHDCPLVSNLTGLHDFLVRRFEFGFQFTALSVLEPFLHNAYNKMIYNVKTVRHAGETLHDLILDHTEEFTIVLRPKKGEVRNALDYSERTKLIVIREYSKIPKDTWARPEIAWLDLLSEAKKGDCNIWREELDNILEYLLDDEITDRRRLETAARHRNMLKDLEKHVDGVT